LVFLFGWGAAVWKDVAFYTLCDGIVGALLAAVPGFIDFLLDYGRARRTCRSYTHGDKVHRTCDLRCELLASMDRRRWFSCRRLVDVAVGALAVAGWYGGELVFVHGMGVKPPRKSSSERVEPASSHRVIRRLGTRQRSGTRYGGGGGASRRNWGPFATSGRRSRPFSRDLRLVI